MNPREMHITADDRVAAVGLARHAARAMAAIAEMGAWFPLMDAVGELSEAECRRALCSMAILWAAYTDDERDEAEAYLTGTIIQAEGTR